MKTVLETSRLLLCQMGPSDLDFVALMLADPEVMRFFPKCFTRDESAAWVRLQQERYERDGCGYWLLLDRGSGEPVGQAGVLMTEVDGLEEAALGYLIHQPFWRRGLATEAAAASRDYAFDILRRARAITLIRPENVPSQRVAAKIGMRPEKVAWYGGFDHLVFAAGRPG